MGLTIKKVMDMVMAMDMVQNLKVKKTPWWKLNIGKILYII